MKTSCLVLNNPFSNYCYGFCYGFRLWAAANGFHSAMKFRLLLALLLLGGCASAPTGKLIVGNHDIKGQVVDARTARPIVSALVVLTLPRGNSWSLPSSFLVGYAYTDTQGKFVIPAHPRPVEDLRRNNSPISVDVYHPDYKQAVDFIPRTRQASDSVIVKMEKGYDDTLVVSISGRGCTYNNPEICKLVGGYLGL